ncbi:MAG: polymerase, sigma-24 subunit, subfamily [Frankiales bacterium]|nr:polymerase, sigma-24 subunit, subfamily [Frankiales bacterium]
MAEFDDFVGPHLDAMWLLASRLAGQGAREDVLQEALLSAWRKRGQYDPARGTAKTWLLVLVADRARKNRRAYRPVVELHDAAATPVDLDLRLDVRRAVETLPARQRLAVELYYVLGLPTAECARVMRCAPGTVSSTLSDARRTLHAKLEVQA